MPRTFSESIATTYNRERISESHVQPATTQKVLRLFGYGSGTDARYVCCLSDDPRVDVHKFKIGQQYLVMALITKDNRVLDSALWKVTDRTWNMLSKYDFAGVTDIEGIDSQLRRINECECLMRYTP